MDTAARQSLIFDADDTLWENNVLFERVQDDFVRWLEHPSLDHAEIRKILTEIEEANIVTHGYGSQVFLRSLAECFTRLMRRPIGALEQARMDEFTAAFISGEVELIPSVGAVLTELGRRHDLYLMTKGERGEQQRKIEASGLAGHFLGVDIVPTKVPETYREVVTDRGLDPRRTWMIGNSPRSDILAARAAGLWAVFIPNANTWAHERADLDPNDEGILHVSTFGDLVSHF